MDSLPESFWINALHFPHGWGSPTFMCHGQLGQGYGSWSCGSLNISPRARPLLGLISIMLISVKNMNYVFCCHLCDLSLEHTEWDYTWSAIIANFYTYLCSDAGSFWRLPLEIWLPFSMGIGMGELGEDVRWLAFLSCSCGDGMVGPCSSLPGRFMLELENPEERKVTQVHQEINVFFVIYT